MVVRPPPSTKRGRELSLLLPLSAKTQLGMQRISVLKHPLFYHIQPRMSLGPTIWLCPRLCHGLIHLLRRPCRPFFRRISFRPGRAAVEPPPLVRPRLSWTTNSITLIVLHRRHPTTAVGTSRPPCIVSPSIVSSEGPIGPVFTVSIQRATRAATSATPLLGVLSPDAPSSGSTPDAPFEIPTSTIEFVQSIEQYSHTGCAREQHAEPLCETAIWHLLPVNPSVPPDAFLLYAPSKKRPLLSKVRFLAENRPPLHGRR